MLSRQRALRYVASSLATAVLWLVGEEDVRVKSQSHAATRIKPAPRINSPGSTIADKAVSLLTMGRTLLQWWWKVFFPFGLRSRLATIHLILRSPPPPRYTSALQSRCACSSGGAMVEAAAASVERHCFSCALPSLRRAADVRGLEERQESLGGSTANVERKCQEQDPVVPRVPVCGTRRVQGAGIGAGLPGGKGKDRDESRNSARKNCHVRAPTPRTFRHAVHRPMGRV